MAQVALFIMVMLVDVSLSNCLQPRQAEVFMDLLPPFEKVMCSYI